MSIFFWSRKRRETAEVARYRLRILLAHERSITANSDLVAILRNEVLASVAKYVPVAIDQVDVTMDRTDTLSTLQIDIHLPV